MDQNKERILNHFQRNQVRNKCMSCSGLWKSIWPFIFSFADTDSRTPISVSLSLSLNLYLISTTIQLQTHNHIASSCFAGNSVSVNFIQ